MTNEAKNQCWKPMRFSRSGTLYLLG